MNMMMFFATIISVMLASMLLVAFKPDNKQDNKESYFLSNRQIKLIPLTLTLLATQLGGGAIVGSAEAAYQYGWTAIFYALGIGLGLFVLSLGIGARLRALQVSTIPELFAKCYQSPALRVFSAIILVFSMFCILVALGVAMRKLLLAIDSNSEWMFLGLWSILVIYTAMGGLRAVVITDCLQISLVLIVFAITGFYLWPSLSNMSFEFSSNGASSLPWSNWLLMPMFFTLIGQDMGQRCFGADSARSITFASLFAGILLVLSALLPVALGVYAQQQGFAFQGESVLITLVSALTNPIIASLFAASIFMAIISTADSLLCATSANISLDILPKLKTSQSKWLTIVIGFAAMILSLVSIDILGIMVKAYSVSVCALFVPIVAAALLSSVNKRSAVWAVFIGLGCYGIFNFYGAAHSTLVSLLAALVVFYFARTNFPKAIVQQN